ncbi:MAG: hypothetical protein ACOVMP_08000 [Chthoniobacterales bacterium]
MIRLSTKTFTACVASIVLSIGAATAQKIENAPPEKVAPSAIPRKLTNELPSKATPTPTATPAPTANPKPSPSTQSVSIEAPAAPDLRTPEQVAADFFGSLQKDQVDAAYEGLAAGTMLMTKGEQSRDLRARTQSAIDAYGPIRGYELVKTDRVGELLERRTYVLHGDVLPLRWRFYFYKGSGHWQLVDLRVDDSLIDLFDEAGVTEKK